MTNQHTATVADSLQVQGDLTESEIEQLTQRWSKLDNRMRSFKAGSVDLQLPSQHHDYSLSITKIEQGELFGLSPLLGSERYTASAQCMEDSELLLIEAKPFQDVLNDNCIIGMSIMRKVAHIYFNRYMNVLKNLQEIAGQISLIQ